MEQEPQGQYFEFEQDSVQIIKFGNNLKGFKGNQNVLFDEIDGPERKPETGFDAVFLSGKLNSPIY